MNQLGNKTIDLEHGSGGYKSWELISQFRQFLTLKGGWTNQQDDAAVYALGKDYLVFTTDGFIVDPIFFPGGDIGKIAVCGTINDLAVMGARPLGLSLAVVIEEGFLEADLFKIFTSIKQAAGKAKVPIVTGDTKVMEKGKLDKISITTAGVGLAKKIIKNSGAKPGDFIISSGDLGEHTVALLSRRFKFKTKIKSDSKPLNQEISSVGRYLNAAKDPTRGGLAANLVEMADKSKVKVVLTEKLLPFKKETKALSGLLGIELFAFASEGRFIAAVSPRQVKTVIKKLQKFNRQAKIIGRAERGRGVFLETDLGGLRKIEMPPGKLIPRIC